MTEVTNAPATPAAAAPVPPTVEGKPIPSPATSPAKADAPKPEAKADAPDVADQKPDVEEAERKKRDFKSRFNEVYGKWKQKEAEVVSKSREIERLSAELEQIRSTPSDQLTFEQQEEMRLRSTVKAERLDQAKAGVQDTVRELQRAQFDAFQARVESVREQIPDFDQVVYRNEVPISDVTTDFLVDSDLGPQVAYWLGKNPADARRIYSLPPHRQGAELARIEARLSAAPQARKVSNAPAPVPTLGGSPAPAQKSPQEMSMSEYAAWRNAKRKAG